MSAITIIGLSIRLVRITWVLCEVRVALKLCQRNRVDIEVIIEVLTFLYATFPVPIVACVSTELAEAHECCAAHTLEVELACPFVAKLVERVALCYIA